MSGIFGIWNRDGKPIPAGLLTKLSDIQGHRGADGSDRWTDDPVGFVFQNLWITPESVGEIQPLACQDAVVMFDGRLDNRRDLLAGLTGSQVSRDSSDAALVGAAYAKFGEALPEQLEGDFALALYDIRRKKLLLARDAIGTRPLYYSCIGKAVVIASECKPILAHPEMSPRPNADMVAAYFLSCFGQERQGWTFFEGISSVLPGQLVVVTPQSVDKRIYWDFGVPEPIRFKTFDQYAEAFGDVFEQAVARRLRSAYPVAVALSGGLDSSSIYCTAETLRRQRAGMPSVLGINLQFEGVQADEPSFLDEIEIQYGVRIDRIPPSSSTKFISGSAEKGLRGMETPFLRGMSDFEYPFERRAQERQARVVMTGHWGDQMMSNSNYWIDLFRRGRWATLARHIREFPRWYTTESPGRYLRSFADDLVRAQVPRSWMPYLRKTRQRLRGDRNWFTTDLWERARRAEALQRFEAPGETVYQRSVRNIVCPMYYTLALDSMSKESSQFDTEGAYPFFDRDLVGFLMAIPGETPCWNGVPKALLRAAMKNVLPPGIAQRRWKASNTQEFNDSVRTDFDSLARLLQGNPMCSKLGYVRKERLASTLTLLEERIAGKGCVYTWQLADLVGLELWLRCFFGENPVRKDCIENDTVFA